MSNLYRVAALLALAAAALFFGFFFNTNTVTLTERGFSPREITISVGETVMFVNKRDKYFWPASDFHPTHAVYPEFDAREALSPGDSWSFTFEKPGLYKYHDHLAPFFFGIVRVRDATGAVVDTCSERGGNLACWQDQIFLALAEEGLTSAYDTVAALYDSEPEFASSCHYVAHNIGLASYGFFREDPRSVMTPKASACASGFYHGFMEAYLGATGDVVAARATCEEIGEALKDSAPDARLQCYHGIGHGAMELLVSGSGVFANLSDMTKEALVHCEAASEGEDERYRCASGIFNGIANFYINGEYGLDAHRENPLALCAQQTEAYQEACYGNMNSVIYWMTDNDFPSAAKVLIAGAFPEHVHSALEYLAGLYAYDSLPSVSPEAVVANCRTLPTDLQSSCFTGFAHGLLEHGTPGQEWKDALSFCESKALLPAEADLCLYEALDLRGWYGSDVAETICAGLPEELRRYCKL